MRSTAARFDLATPEPVKELTAILSEAVTKSKGRSLTERIFRSVRRIIHEAESFVNNAG